MPLTVDGDAASSTNPATWAPFSLAAASTAGVGLGFALNGDGVVCVDIDHCLVDGIPTSDTQRLLDMIPDTYVEVSPSGDGLHVWGFASLSEWAGGVKICLAGVAVEFYRDRRYLTVTGKSLSSTRRLADLSGVFPKPD